MKWRWWPGRWHVDTTDEAREVLQHLEQRDAEVDELSKQLRAAERRNHFSIAVYDAIARTREK